MPAFNRRPSSNQDREVDIEIMIDDRKGSTQTQEMMTFEEPGAGNDEDNQMLKDIDAINIAERAA